MSEHGQLIHMNGARPVFLVNVSAKSLLATPKVRPPVMTICTLDGMSLYQASPAPV